jgi:hypothetical protein
MQRSKIKVGAEYAVSNLREWERYGVKFVQVLDADRWYALGQWDERGRSEDAETVDEPHRPIGHRLEVPSHIRRRGDSIGYRTAPSNRVLVRYVSVADDGSVEYGTPTLMQTRHLVAERAEAEERIAAHVQRRDEEERQWAAVAAERKAQEQRFNGWLASFGAGPVIPTPYDNGRFVVAASDLEMLLGHAETWRSHLCPEGHCCGQES